MRNLRLEDTDFVRQAIRTAANNSRDQLLLHRLHCVLLVGLGRSCHEVADWFGDSTRTIERWVGAFNRRGVAGLSTDPPVGRRPRLSDETARRVAFELKQAPCVCGFPDKGWGARLLMQHLKSHYGVTMGLRQCQRTLNRLRAAQPPRSPD